MLMKNLIKDNYACVTNVWSKQTSVSVRSQYMEMEISPSVDKDAINNTRLKVKTVQESREAINESRFKD